MITVTELAKEELRTILVASGTDSEEELRLLPTENGGFVLGRDTEMSGDQMEEYKGYKVLLVGIEYFQIQDGITVDCQATGEGTILFVR